MPIHCNQLTGTFFMTHEGTQKKRDFKITIFDMEILLGLQMTIHY